MTAPTLESLLQAEPEGIQDKTKKSPANYAIAYVLKKYNISQNRMAIALGVSRSTVNQWVNGVAEMMSGYVPDIARALLNLIDDSLSSQAVAEFWIIYQTFTTPKPS